MSMYVHVWFGCELCRQLKEEDKSRKEGDHTQLYGTRTSLPSPTSPMSHTHYYTLHVFFRDLPSESHPSSAPRAWYAAQKHVALPMPAASAFQSCTA
eukprot:scaffold54672_cov62-Phaeocystis_antarctica.AAC.6